MKVLSITTGTLNEFETTYGVVDFSNFYGDELAFDISNEHLSDDIDLEHDEFWCSIFEFEGERYVIAAEGTLNSNGNYAVAKI